MKTNYTIITLALINAGCMLVNLTSAQPQIIMTDSAEEKIIGTSIYYLPDPYHRFDLADIINPVNNKNFIRSTENVLNFGNVEQTVWNKFTVVNQSSKNWILTDLDDNDTLTFYYQDTVGLYHHIISGTAFPISARTYKTNVFAFDLPIKNQDTATFYLKVSSRNCEYALIISSTDIFIKNQFKRVLAKGIYFGLVLLIIIFNIALFFTIRDFTYLYYILYVLFTALLISVISGFYPFILQDRFHFLWNKGPAITALGGICLVLFSSSFLKLKTFAPLSYKILFYLFVPVLLLNIVLTFWGKVLLASIVNQVIGPVGLIILSATAIYIYRKGFKAARFYVIASSFYFIGVFIYVLKSSAIIRFNLLTSNSMEIGSALEMIFFSVSIGDRINLYRKEKSKAQNDLINSLREKSKMQHEMLELEARALRSQMNPHFIFNCMNSIKSLIQQKEEDKAINYLTAFSRLLRTVLQNADKREISLFDELETCRLYTHLESLRFDNKFSYEFKIESDIDLKSIYVPALILQPLIENAIWHGLIPKEGNGYIEVKIEKQEGTICCIIDDDGIGRQNSMNNKFAHHPPNHESKGVKLTQSRLMLENELNERDASISVIDKKNGQGQNTGTTVVLTFKGY